MLTHGFRPAAIMLLPLLLLTCQKAPSASEWRLQQEQELTTTAPALRAVVKSVTGESDVRLYLVWPDPKRTRLRVLDNPGNVLRLAQAMREQSCLAGVNGGFFRPDFTPLGLVVSAGRRLHAFERAKLLSGLAIVPDRQPKLLRVKEFSSSRKLSEALQAGPFLIDRGKAVRGLHNNRSAPRTLILTDRHGRYGLAVVEPAVTLADLAAILAAPGIVHELKITRALNLDGGGSTALWVGAGTGEELYLRERNRVANFLCVQAVPPRAAGRKPTD